MGKISKNFNQNIFNTKLFCNFLNYLNDDNSLHKQQYFQSLILRDRYNLCKYLCNIIFYIGTNFINNVEKPATRNLIIKILLLLQKKFNRSS